MLRSHIAYVGVGVVPDGVWDVGVCAWKVGVVVLESTPSCDARHKSLKLIKLVSSCT